MDSPVHIKSRSKSRRRGKRGGISKGHRAGARKCRPKYARLGLKYLRILYWNCSSVKQRRPILDNLVYTADICALQETQLGDRMLKIAGFQTFYNRTHLGQAILIRDDIGAYEVDMSRWNCNQLQLHAVRIQTTNPLLLVNVYACNAKVSAQMWMCLNEIMLTESNVVFCGDFNAKSRMWGNKSTNKQGEELEDALVSMDLICLNDGRITRMATRQGDEDSAIDLALAASALASDCRWNVLGHYGSDHYPCLVLVKKDRIMKPRTNFHIHPQNIAGQGIHRKICHNIQRVRRNRRKRQDQPPWWNEEVEKAWMHKRQTVQAWQRARKSGKHQEAHLNALKQDMKEAVTDFKAVANEAKTRKWEHFCQEVCKDKSLKKFWALHKATNDMPLNKRIGDFQNEDQVWLRSNMNK